MKDTMVKGVPDYKIERLKKHLLKVEKLTGGKLRRTSRGWADNNCPISDFSPNKDGGKRDFMWTGNDGVVTYWGDISDGDVKDYNIFASSDTKWWDSLKPETRRRITKYISNWIKNEKKALP